VKEQEYSMKSRPLRCVVIEEDGKTEEEFVEEILNLNSHLESLTKEARQLDRSIGTNIRLLAGEA